MPLSNTGVDRFLAQNYYSKTQLNAGQLDNLYYGEDEFIATSAGAGDAGKPVKLDAAGHIDASMINDADVDHGGLGGLTDDDHTQYALLLGRSGGQTIIGGTASGNNLTLNSSSNATKGKILLGAASAFDEVNTRLGIGTASPSRGLHVLGSSDVYLLLRSGTFTTGAELGFDGTQLYLWNYQNTALSFATNNTSRMTIAAGGDVSIGGALAVTGAITQNSVAVVTTSGSQTLTNKTLTAPTIGATEWSNANHTHAGATTGGTISHTALTNIGTNTHGQIDSHIAATTEHGATGAVVGTTNTQTLTNKTLTTPIIGTIYGSAAANGDIVIAGTSDATKTTSYVSLQPGGGDVVVGGSTTDHNFEIQESASNYRLTFNLNSSGTNYFNSYSTAPGVLTGAPLGIVASQTTFYGQDNIIIESAKTPASASATGTAGMIAWNSTHLFVCVATDTWKRVAIATW